MRRSEKPNGFRPVLHCGKAVEIPARLFVDRGIRAVVLDVDNTITRWELTSVPEESLAWINSLKEEGLKLALLSNGLKSKLGAVESQVGVTVVPGIKPFLSSFVRCRDYFGCADSEIAIVGDQCLTDIWPANRLGWLTILVDPMSERDFLGTRIYRWIEAVFHLRSPIEGNVW